MDFITSLPNSEVNNFIMVVVDRLTKYTNFFSMSRPFKASIVSMEFMEIFQKLHGNRKVIVRYIDPIFTSNFLTHLFSCLGIQ
jgi:hypothetical protein